MVLPVNILPSTSASSVSPIVTLLQDVLRKVEASVFGTIEAHVVTVVPHSSSPAVAAAATTTSETSSKTITYHPKNDGIDFLDTKNTLLLSYLIDLVVHLRNYFRYIKQQQEEQEKEDDQGDDANDITTITTTTVKQQDCIRNNETRLIDRKSVV